MHFNLYECKFNQYKVGLINNEGKNLKTKQSIRNIKKYIKSKSCRPSTLHGLLPYIDNGYKYDMFHNHNMSREMY